MLADRMEHLLQEQAADLFPVSPSETFLVRKAIRYVRDLKAWSASRFRTDSDSSDGSEKRSET